VQETETVTLSAARQLPTRINATIKDNITFLIIARLLFLSTCRGWWVIFHSINSSKNEKPWQTASVSPGRKYFSSSPKKSLIDSLGSESFFVAFFKPQKKNPKRQYSFRVFTLWQSRYPPLTLCRAGDFAPRDYSQFAFISSFT
jgi:hypothetical protein